MSDDYEARFVEKVSQVDREARHRRAVAKIAEPLLAGLSQEGIHSFPPVQYRAIVQFLLEGEPGQIAKAMKRDRFKISALEFVCVRGACDMATISEFAREHGIAQRTLHDRAAKAGLVSKTSGARKLFGIVELKTLLAGTSG